MPSTHYVVIDSQYYGVHDGELESTQQSLLEAVRQSGGFVRLRDGHREVDVLVTPSTAVRIEHAAAADVDSAGDGSATDYPRQFDVDLDWWPQSG